MSISISYKVSIWPLFCAPVVGIVYFMSLKLAFVMSMESAVGTNVGSYDPLAANWGTHWIYRIVAETFSIGMASWVAAGLATGRERAAGVTASSTVGLVFFFSPYAFLFWLSLGPNEINVAQVLSIVPWYQLGIDVLLILAGLCNANDQVIGVGGAMAKRTIPPSGFV